jgi:hypothetical protein
VLKQKKTKNNESFLVQSGLYTAVQAALLLQKAGYRQTFSRQTDPLKAQSHAEKAERFNIF